ncbi:ComF family protein [Chloroflexota bacterium]
MLPQIAKLKRIALDLFFPRCCVGCGREGDFICGSCRQSLSRIEPPLCPRCGRPQSDGILCPSCTGWQAKIDGIRSPYIFDGVMRQAVYQLKYRNLRALVKPLAELLHDYLTANLIPIQVLVPVPLHEKRLRERGYNQSELLARELGKLTGLPVVTDCLTRQRYALPQARTVNVEERRDNVASAFACGNDKLQNRQVLLIDDVATSGSTLDSCATALKATDASSVWGLSMAREI